MSFFEKQDIINSANLKKYHLQFSAGFLMKIFQLDKINKLYSDSLDTDAIGFVDKVLGHLNIQIDLSEKDLEKIPKTGPFIMVANHPFGFLDGLIMIKIMKKIRPDSKVMANYMLQKIEPLKDDFLAVNPFEDAREKGTSLVGIKQAISILKEGHALGLFPAGEVSTKYPGDQKIADREWQVSAVKLIRKANVPVVPMHFAGANSQVFHFLGRIHPALRTAKIPSELLTQKNRTIQLRIGQPILPKEQEEFPEIEQFARYLRAKTYAIGTEVNVRKFFRPSLNALKKPQPIADRIDSVLLQEEIKKLGSENIILSQSEFEVYIAHSNRIPLILNEIGRLREITFRAVGEGSNQSIDIDEYDLYYLHLFIWDKVEQRIAGAYRIGQGDLIAKQYGRKGFYTQSLFKYRKEFDTILENSIELGRSFVTKEYQTKPLPLFILWRGILHFLILNPQYRYILGPVTISNEYSGISKWLIIEFIKRNYFDHDLAQWVKARTEFEVIKKDRDIKILDAINFKDIKYLDKLIAEIEPSEFKVPVLLKKYLKQNAKIIGFNIDPKFNNALDGLMVLNLDDLPQGTIDKLKLEMKEQSNSLPK